MSFLWPEFLWLLFALPACVALYLWILQRRNKTAVRFTNLGILKEAVGGSLRWLITIPQDGALPLDGVAPGLIEWRSPHPAAALEERGCSLARIEATHPDPASVQSVLDAIGFSGPFRVSRGQCARLVAHIETPGGPRQLA